jgi:hypothetical protein
MKPLTVAQVALQDRPVRFLTPSIIASPVPLLLARYNEVGLSQPARPSAQR